MQGYDIGEPKRRQHDAREINEIQMHAAGQGVAYTGNKGEHKHTCDSSLEMYCSLRSLERAALSLLARMRFTRCGGSPASSDGDSPAPPAARRPCDAVKIIQHQIQTHA